MTGDGTLLDNERTGERVGTTQPDAKTAAGARAAHVRRGPLAAYLHHLYPGARRLARAFWSPFTTLVVAASFLASCLPFSAGAFHTSDLSTLEMDPLAFTRITPRDDVQIRAAEILAGTGAAARTRWYVVEYREHENRKGLAPEGDAEYVNLFLVSEVENAGGPAGVVRSRYLVAEVWRYYPTQGVKTCHQWTIWEDDPRSAPTRATFQFLVEDFNNVFLGDRRAPLDAPTLQRLGDFYLTVKRFLAKRVEELSGDVARRI